MRTAILLFGVLGTALSGPSCGQTPIKPTLTPGYAGAPAVPHSWPWHVIWCSTGWNGGCQMDCVGSVIGDRWVMVGGMCVYHDLNPTSYLVKAGINKYSTDLGSDEQDAQIMKVKSIYLYPQFSPYDEYPRDMAIIELATPLTLNDQVLPVCLPADDSVAMREGSNGWTYGWYNSAAGKSGFSDELLQAQVPFVDFNSCQPKIDAFYKDWTFCAGKLSATACVGDPAAPLVAQSPSGAWHLLGLTSIALGCTDTSVYTRVQTYCDFVNSSTKGAVTCQAFA